MIAPGFRICIICCILGITSCRSDRPIDEYNGFEAEELSSIWNDWRFLPGAVEIQSDIVKSGKSAARITVNQGDQMDDWTVIDCHESSLPPENTNEPSN